MPDSVKATDDTYTLCQEPLIVVSTHGGGRYVRHYIVTINGVFALNDSSDHAWTIRRMFPDDEGFKEWAFS